ncbi:uncharacterized protein PHACADRAFT_251078 [Phanerochaete carnosa HHB-10118-sp]|uniref:DUF6535 domain-containing protein n=1 Tax=Phanerochaete carnosa (strain HHB-10118-sp) TaxID=650164 RepID=K5W0S8_PHACS|nr:uncharacterized protein PHACADRAFT_251078 [Phanerochaete carnosa HHB-10118-sp]EKM57423.1 hypothetical protein PHACADRAFT_251078 [Phanerochaete carnosa HHB-10118-sp]
MNYIFAYGERRRHYSQRNASQGCTRRGLSACQWAGIEAHVAEDDEEKMKQSSDDISTLLVLAGLFSASILTAFVV